MLCRGGSANRTLKVGKVSSSIAAVIMAGGKGTRLGQLGSLLPKCLLPLGNNATLLSRLIKQFQSAGIDKAAICCSPENHVQVEAFIEAAGEPTEKSLEKIHAVSCSNTQHGPLPALAEIAASLSAEWFLLCMADIFFQMRPYDNLTALVASQPDIDGFVITGADQMPVGGWGTGAVVCEGSSVRAISYRPFAPEQQLAGDIRQWSGSFLFRASLIADLLERVDEYHGAPYEAWLQGLLDRGARCEWIDAGPFVNVNSTREYEFLVHHDTAPYGH
ncbi:NTP transferase domain-containing protein [Verrucomicrobiota bacterium sgz303538]